jgi:L-malate glycosyltransferase
MKLVLSLHELALGGTTVNAIDLACALRDAHGHEVVIFASPGPMLGVLQRSGLRWLPAPTARAHPCLARMRALRKVVREELPQVLHVWDTWALLDAYCAVHFPMRLPMLYTDMQMAVTAVLPRAVPSTFGTPDLVDSARRAGMQRVDLLLPPVDLRRNAPGAVDSSRLREQYVVGDDEVVLVIVSRLVESMKGESLRRSIEVIGELGRRFRLRLLIAGDGPARPEIEERARAVNAALGRPAVTLLGALLDPRPAYAVADIVIGMGGSSLRGMAFGKPVVVVGESGFAMTLTPQTAPLFERQGLFGRGSSGDLAISASHLRAAIEELAASQQRRKELGEFSMQFARRHFALDTVAERLDVLLRASLAATPSLATLLTDGLRSAVIYARERRFLWRAGPPDAVTAVDEPAPA